MDNKERNNEILTKLKKLTKNRYFLGLMILLLGIFIGGTVFSGSGEIKDLKADKEELKKEISTLKDSRTEDEYTLGERDETIESQQADLDSKDQEIKGLQEKVDSAKPWFEMEEEERQAEEKRIAEEKEKKEAEEEAKRLEEEKKEEEERIAKEKKEEEERIAKEKAEKEAEAQKYKTGITYEDLARNPKDNIGNLVTFKGKIIQVMKGTDEMQYRMAVDSNYDKVILIAIDNDKLTDGNILEDDIITIEGMFLMENEYTTVMGASRTIPAVLVDNFYR